MALCYVENQFFFISDYFFIFQVPIHDLELLGKRLKILDLSGNELFSLPGNLEKSFKKQL